MSDNAQLLGMKGIEAVGYAAAAGGSICHGISWWILSMG